MWSLKVKIDILDKPIEVIAEEVDFSHLPLLVIKKIRQREKNSLIELPDSSAYTEFSKFKTLIIPYSNICHAGEFKDEDHSIKVIPLSLAQD